MKGKRILITGATSGIGKEIALALAQMGGELIIVSRSEEKCQQVVNQIQDQTSNPAVEFFKSDLSSQKDIRRLAKAVQEKYDRLDVLVNNAGGFFWKRKESVDGIEMTFALNHLNYFLVTNLLLNLLQNSPSARIVNVASGSHSSQEIDFDDLQLNKGYMHFKAYGKSKLANLYFTYELARRLAGSRVTVNAFTPGFTVSNIGRGEGKLVKILNPLINSFAIPTEQGAITGIYLASSKEVEGISGKYFQELKPVPSSPLSIELEPAKRLWKISEELTGLR